jgi:hypothetical protein
MIGLPAGENATKPTDRWRITEKSAQGVDFSLEAVAAFEAVALDALVAFEIGVDAEGVFVDARTGLPNPVVVEQYGRMKYGDVDAVTFFAGRLAAAALQSERLMALMREAVATERVVYMTTVAVFNVPSASNLLLRATAAHLNIMLTRKGLAPVIVAEQTRLSDSPLGYSTRTVQERRDDLGAGRGVTIVPEHFRHEYVIFLDDLFSTGYTIYRAERRLKKADVAGRFYLIAARMDPQAVGASYGQVEDRLNDHVITGTLQSLAPMLKRGNFAAVQKLVKTTLAPKHTDQLPGFLPDIPTSSILKIYAAAASDGFRHRSRQIYLPAMLVLERELQDRGAIDAEGHIVRAPSDVFALSL